MTPEKLRGLEALREKAKQGLLEEINYRDALEAAAPELFAAAHKLEALEEAMREAESFLGSEQNSATATVAYIRDSADRILKERSK